MWRWPRPRCHPGCSCRCRCGSYTWRGRCSWRSCGSGRWGSSTAQSIHRHGISSASRVGINFVHYEDNRLPVIQGKRKRFRRVRATAYVGKVVRAEVARIKTAQIRCREDGASASSINVHIHALSRAGFIGKRVGIVVAREPVTQHPRAYLRYRTRAGNTVAKEPVSLRRISGVDNSVDHNGRARWGRR